MTDGAPSHEGRRAQLERHGRTPLTRTSLGGRILSASQLPWFRVLPPKGFGVLTTTGRRTGKPRRKCVRAIRRGDTAYLVALRGKTAWLQNIRAEPQVTLRIRGGRFRGLAREVMDPLERDRARGVYCGTVNPFDRAEYRLWMPGRPTPERIRSLHQRWFTEGAPIAIDLGDSLRAGRDSNPQPSDP